MKTEEDEAFEDIERRQGGFQAKRAMAADKLQEDRIKYGTSWEKDGERIDPMSVYKEPVTEREALKLALEALEHISKVKCDHSKGLCTCEYREAADAIKAALAQPAQEPVAWVNIGNLQGLTLGHYSHVEIYTDESAGRTPLYTAPPQRPWVGLTDEEIDEGNKQSWVTKQAWESAVWWASEMLKEKNNG